MKKILDRYEWSRMSQQDKVLTILGGLLAIVLIPVMMRGFWIRNYTCEGAKVLHAEAKKELNSARGASNRAKGMLDVLIEDVNNAEAREIKICN